jgi:hypothetical protein
MVELDMVVLLSTGFRVVPGGASAPGQLFSGAEVGGLSAGCAGDGQGENGDGGDDGVREDR